MWNKRIMIVVFLALVGVVLLVFSSGQATSPLSGSDETLGNTVVGTFALTVTPPGLPSFQGLLTFHPGGTVSETDASLHPNSANPFFPFNGSDGYGAWELAYEDTVVFKFVKLVFDGETNEHIGYLVVDATALIAGDPYTGLESDANVLIGPDLFDPLEIIQLGPTDAVGTRITVD